MLLLPQLVRRFTGDHQHILLLINSCMSAAAQTPTHTSLRHARLIFSQNERLHFQRFQHASDCMQISQ